MAEAETPSFEVPVEFFILKGPGKTENNFIYECQMCTKGVTISCHAKSRQNLKNHVKSKHGTSYERFLSILSDKRQTKKEQDSDITDIIQGPKQVTLSTVWGQGKLTQRHLDRAVVDYHERYVTI
jgi:hypothetical protein